LHSVTSNDDASSPYSSLQTCRHQENTLRKQGPFQVVFEVPQDVVEAVSRRHACGVCPLMKGIASPEGVAKMVLLALFLWCSAHPPHWQPALVCCC
jgi:hypothetical protein